TRAGLERQKELLRERDILVTPEFDEELTSVAFTRMADAIRYGYEAVMKQRAAFEAFALSPEEYAAYRESLRDPRPDELPVVEFVRLDNRSKLADSIIEARLRGIELGKPLDVEAVEQAIGRVYGLEIFQNVRY